MENLQTQISLLLKEEQYESAYVLGTFLLSMYNKSRMSTTNSLDLENELFSYQLHPKVLFADALYGKKEYQRAQQYYKSASNEYLQFGHKMEEPVDYLALKQAKCCVACQNNEDALKIMKTTKTKTIEGHMLMGRIYHQQGLSSKAKECFQTALRINPYLVEASLALTEMNQATFNETPLMDFSILSRKNCQWIEDLIECHEKKNGNQLSCALQLFKALESQFSDNLHCLVEISSLYSNLQQYGNAKASFLKLRKMDSKIIDKMDSFASVLFKQGELVALNRLSHECLEIDESRAESWLTASWFSIMKGEKDGALQFCEQQQRMEAAVASFTTAHNMSQDLLASKGLVESYLGMEGKYNEACIIARGAIQNNPRNALATYLYAKVLSTKPENKEKARKTFEMALAIDPKMMDASLSLADLYLKEQHYEDAVKTSLEGLSKHHSRDFIHLKLAEVFTMNHQYNEALASYHTALSLSPSFAPALQGLERLEKLMRGVDPDTRQDEGDQENDVSEISYQTSDYGGIGE